MIKRTKEHVSERKMTIKTNRIDEGWLGDIEYKDNLFPDIDYTVYA
jgi:1,4-alpha-glucan branching enzyme